MSGLKHATMTELESGLENIRHSPKDGGVLEMIVCRPLVDERAILTEAMLDLAEGLVGDGWKSRGSTRTPDGSANPEMQLNVMNARVIELLAQEEDRWALAGDQLFVDLDLSTTNLPAGSRLRVGEAVIEITAEPHLGCAKFKARFGADALAAVNSPRGRELRLRGANARIVSGGMVRVGDQVAKI